MGRSKIRTIFVTGCKSDWPPQKTVQKELGKIIKELWPSETGYVITGTSRPIDAKIVTACKALKVRVLQMPANFQMLTGASAEQLRNADALKTFSPECIVVFTKMRDIEDDTVLCHLFKIAYKARIEWKRINKEKVTKQ